MPIQSGVHVANRATLAADRNPKAMSGAQTAPELLQFSTESYPVDRRWDAWSEALQHLPVEQSFASSEPPWHAKLTIRTAMNGIQVGRLSGGPQTMTCLDRSRGAGLLLIRIDEGEAILPELDERLGTDDLCYIATSKRTAIRFADDFTATVLHAPLSAFGSRVVRLPDDRPGVLRQELGLVDVLGSLMVSTARSLGDLTPEQFHPIGSTLADLVISAIASGPKTRSALNRSQYRDAMLRRLCQSAEAHLSDPDVTIEVIAADQGVSPRMAAKAFAETGQTFKTYLRNRRLDRCSEDLRSLVHASLAVGTIAARWGFLDAAAFSRSFQERFGMAPRVWRQAARTPARTPQANRGPPHPLPSSSASRRRICEPVPNDGVDGGLNGASGPGTLLRHHHLPVSARSVHWGYFSRSIPPVLTVDPGDVVTIETLTHHAYDDYARMIEGDTGAESVFGWTADKKNVNRRGAGPMDASVLGRGAGEGFGVHVCTGPVAVRGAAPGDVLEICVLDIVSRPSRGSQHAGRSFGSNAATWWGYHYRDLLTEPKPREVVTIYEMQQCRGTTCAHGVYNYRWTPQTDPAGVLHPTYDYPGVPVDRTSIDERHGILSGIHIPVRPHFGVVALAPSHSALLDSVPPSYFGGNIDNWRLGAGSSVFLPVAIAGGLLAVGDPHASQGDGELCGTAIECSLTGTFRLVLHRRAELPSWLGDLNYPLIETPDAWVIQGFSHPNHLAEFGEKAQSEVYKNSSLDLAMQDAFRKARRFLMIRHGLSEDEAISLLSVAVDFGVTQVVDGNWGMHAVIRKTLFEG